jgi:hypothetical protein
MVTGLAKRRRRCSGYRLAGEISKFRRAARYAMRRKIYRPATHEDGGRRDETAEFALFSIDYFVINASLPR